jgi:flagella basal body P-ring formation protein FlgA
MRWLVLALLATPAAAETVVAARTIRSQTVLGPADLAVIDGEVPGAAIALDEVLGLEARVILYAGRPVLLDQVGPPALVDRNQVVELTFREGALTITAEGRSLGRGGVGDTVRVMNLASKKTVTGLIMDDGSIVVRRP